MIDSRIDHIARRSVQESRDTQLDEESSHLPLTVTFAYKRIRPLVGHALLLTQLKLTLKEALSFLGSMQSCRSTAGSALG